MLGIWNGLKTSRLRSDYVCQIIVYSIAAVISGGMSFGALFYLWSGKQQNKNLNLIAPVFVGALIFSLIVFEIVKVLRDGYTFYVHGEKKVFSSKNYDAVKTLQIGPLTNLKDKALVLKLRWRPQPKKSPKVRSFQLHLQTPVEPTATFSVRLIGKSYNEEFEVAHQSIIQKIDLTPRGQSERVAEVYDDWREVVFAVVDSFPQYFLELRLSVDYPDNDTFLDIENAEMVEQLWVEVFLGLKLADLRHQRNYELSNVGSATIRIK